MSFLRDMVTRVFGEPVENLQPNVIVDPDNSTYIMHVNSDGSLTTNATIQNTTTLGQQLSSASYPVVPASDYNFPIQGVTKEVVGNGTGVVNGANTDLFGWQDMSAYPYLSLTISGTYSGTLTFQSSNDQVVISSTPLQLVGTFGPTNQSTSTTSTSQTWHGPRLARYFRVRMTSFSSNASLAGLLELYGVPPFFTSSQVTAQPGNTQNTTPWLFAGPTSHFVQSAGGSTTVGKASSGSLWSAVVTATGTAELDVYDNASAASGVKLLAIPANAAVGTIYSFPGGAPASSGITSGGVANCPAVTFYYA